MRDRSFFLGGPAAATPLRRVRPAWVLAIMASLLAASAAAQPSNKSSLATSHALAAPVGSGSPELRSDESAPKGGAANADFDSLIDLIISTVATETWAENGGGEAEIRPFPTGVLVDAAGTLRLRSRSTTGNQLADLREGGRIAATTGRPEFSDAGRASSNQGGQSPRHPSELRYVSLPRLEREIARRQAARQPLDQEMLTLAGLQRVRYVFLYPESGDLVLAGPAGDWFVDEVGRILSLHTKQPVVRLDDLLVLLRRGASAAESYFGCAINPRQEALAKTQAFLASYSQRPLQPSQRKRWLRELRDSMGTQDIEIFGIDPASRAASVLVEADYHMKLIGMGLVEGVAGVESYLDLLKWATERAGGFSPPPMSVLRWWFALHYDAIAVSPQRDAFELVGQGVRVLSENELLAAQGQRVHTGQSDPLNRQFADSFTAHFAQLATKYPVYGELRNVFDLAMAVALIDSEKLMEQAGWTPSLFLDGERLRLPSGPVPRQVETVINHRIINRQHIVAGVSGGVMVAPSDLLRLRAMESEATAPLGRKDQAAQLPATLAWWWDARERAE